MRPMLSSGRHRSGVDHLARTSTMILTSTLVNGVLGIAYWTAAGRGYDAATIGVASALVQAITLASLLATLGLGQTLIQRLPNASDEFWSLAVNAVVFAGATSGAIAGAVSLVVLPQVSGRFDVITTPGFALIVVAGTAAMTVANLLDYIFIGQRAAAYIPLRSAAFGVLKLVLLAAPLLLLHAGAMAIVGSWVLAAAITSWLTCARLIPRLGRTHRWTPRGVGAYLRALTPQLANNHVISLSAVLLPTLMPTLVVARASSEANAYFYMAWLMSSVMLSVSQAVAGSLLAEGSYEPGAMAAQLRRAIRLTAVLLALPALGVVLFGKPLLGVFGPQYAQHSYPLLLLFLLVVLPDAATNIYVTALRLSGKPGAAAALNVVLSGSALVTAALLLPRLGASGAVWGWLVGELAGSAVAAAHLYGWRRRRPLSRRPLAEGVLVS
jgi:O-antigen/teichoic acid export membrane protein